MPPQDARPASPMGGGCTLPYPERFHRAVDFVEAQPAGARDIKDDTLLLLYALNQQATAGPCNEPKPWGWNVVDTAKWQSWKSLGNMSGMEAMRLFVRTLEEDQPDWHAFPMPPVSRSAASGGKAFLPAGIAAAAAGAGGAATTGSAAGAPATTWTASLKPGSWSPLPLPPDARKPAPRYEHGTAYVDGRVIVIGGNYAGRYLGDTWAFDLTSQRWSQLALTRADADAAAGAPAAAEGADAAAAAAAAPAAPPAPPPAFPACAGFSVTQHGGLLYLLGGHERSKATASPAAASTSGGGAATLAVRTLDPKTLTVRTLPTTGTAPVARGGHCAVAIGGRIYVFGGEDTGRRSLGDLHVLDLATLAWSQPTTTGAPPPPPRSAHVATAWADRYLLVFGGGSVATCYNDLRLLDTATMAWIPVSLGPGSVSPTPRAGHAAALLGSVWYVVGGGNNVKGCTDMLALELGGLTHAGTAADATGSSGGKGGGVTLSWRNVASIALRDALSSEGMGLVAVPQVHALLAFGGYNGKYQQGVSVFAPGPAAAAAAPSAPGSAAPPAKQPSASAATLTTTTSNGSTAAAAAKANKAALPPPPPPMDVPALLKQLDAAKQSANAAMADAVTLKNQLTAAQGSIQDLEAACEAANSALQAEVANKLRLEAQIAEMRRQVSEAAALEREVERLKRQVAEMEAAASKKAASSSGGLFGYIMGGSSGGGGGSQ